jgi:phosphoserine phosphatase
LIKVVILDMDRTLLRGRSIDHFSRKFGFENSLAKVRFKLEMGELTHREATKMIVSFLKGLRVDEVLNACDELSLSPGARRLLLCLKKNKIKSYIVSDSITAVTDYFADKLGFDGSIANTAGVKEGVFNGEVRFATIEGCCMHSICKREALRGVARREGVSPREVLAIGDSSVDTCMLEEAGLGVAYNGNEKVQSVADMRIKNLGEVIDVLDSRRC